MGLSNQKLEEQVWKQKLIITSHHFTEEEQRLWLKRKLAQNQKTSLILWYFHILLFFRYIPMGGLVIAFQDYQPFLDLRQSLCWV